MEQPKELYRYEKSYYGDKLTVSVDVYPIVSYTPKGYWIEVSGMMKWTSNSATRRFAYPTKKEAIWSYICRIDSSIKMLTGQLERAKTALAVATEMRKQEQVPDRQEGVWSFSMPRSTYVEPWW